MTAEATPIVATLAALLATTGLLAPGETQVASVKELRAAVAAARPGSTIRIAAGEYEGGLYFSDLRGESGRPIMLAAADPEKPPLFRGGANGIHLSKVEHVELRDLDFANARANGVSVDAGGARDAPSRHVVLRNLSIRDVGLRGNEDGIKLSGVDDFLVADCTVERWGAGGSGIDMVGCHRGVVEGCRFAHDGSGGNGVQAKGGSSKITIRANRFDRAGQRAVNLGGSTGAEWFRPALGEPPFAEASELTVEGNTIHGSDAAVAFVGVDGALVRFNTIHAPARWAIRILQETTAAGFVPCRNGEFSRNLVAFQSSRWSEGGVNVGPGTEPASFRFADNWWYCVDTPERSRPRLPVE